MVYYHYKVVLDPFKVYLFLNISTLSLPKMSTKLPIRTISWKQSL